MGEYSSIVVDPANAEQLRAWDGDEGAYWAAHADTFDRAIRAHHDLFIAAAGIGPDDRVLDVGCGTGETSRDAARRATAGSVCGVDLSAAMLEVARRRAHAEGLANVTFVQADAQIHAFETRAFDVAISRTGAMFFADRLAAFRNIADALRTDGRLTLLTWQAVEHNEWIRELSSALAAGRDRPTPPPDAPSPFSLADPDRVRSLLHDAGFRDVELSGHRGPMWFGETGDDAFPFLLGLLGWMLDGLDGDSRERALDALRATIRAHETADGVVYESATWTITAVR